MSFNPFAAGGVDVDKLPYFALRKVQSIGTSHGFELVKIEPMRDNRETSMGRLDLEDLFVRSGEIVKGTEVPEKYNPDENKTYMHLILSNDEGTEVYIDVTDLIDMPDAGKVPLDNDNTLTVEQLNLIKKVFGDNISANTTVLDIILSIASIFENTEIWAEDVRVKNVTNGGTFEFQYVFKPNKSTDQVQLALQNIDKEFKIVHDNITTIGQTIVNLETKVDNNYTEINDKITIIDNSIDSINNSITTIEGNITEINTSIGDMNKIITNHTTAINTINEQITNINKTISDNYTDLSKKITAIDNSLTEYKTTVDNKFATIDSSIEEIQGNITTINQEITSIKTSIESIQIDLSRLGRRIEKNEDSIKKIKEELKKLVLTGGETNYGIIDIKNQTVSLIEAVGKHDTTAITGEVFNDYTQNVASGTCSHTSGYNNQSTANYGFTTNAFNRNAAQAALASGYGNNVLSTASNGFVNGYNNKITQENEVAIGKFNDSTTIPLARSVGDGTSDTSRSNLEYLSLAGNHFIKGSYIMHDIPENADLNDYFTDELNGGTKNENIWYRADGRVARTLKNLPQCTPAIELLSAPRTGFVMKVMTFKRYTIVHDYPTVVQVIYTGAAIFMRTFSLEVAAQWGRWYFVGGGNDTQLSSDYLSISDQATGIDLEQSEVIVSTFDGRNLIISLVIIPNTPFSNLTIPLTSNFTRAMGVFPINNCSFDYSKTNKKEFKYFMEKDLSSITITSINGEIAANDKIDITISGYINPILVQ